MKAGGRPRADGRTEEQWRTLLNQARDALTDPQKRSVHLATFDHDEDFIDPPPVPLYIENMELIPAGEFQMGGNDEWDEGFYEFSPTTNPFSGRSIQRIIDNYTYSNELHVLRGGSWYNTVQNVQVAKRSGVPPTYANSNIGFRCVKLVSQ